MFCPVCKAVYRHGFRRCADCEVALVDQLPSEELPNGVPEEERLGGDLRRIWAGDDQRDCVNLCQELKSAGILYAMSQNVKSRRMDMRVDWKFEIAVPAADESRAKELLGLPETIVEWDSELTEEDENQALCELPEGEESPEFPNKRVSYLEPWYPEDTTAQVWLQEASDASTMVEMSLKENRIRVRVERQEDGSKKYFVLPEDQADAPEIVREIVEDSPPT